MSRSPTSSRLRHLDHEHDLDQPSTKRRYVRTLFDTVETSYDRFTRLFSFGMDRSWKRQLVRLAGTPEPLGGRVLDLATGTGDIAAALLEHWPETSVVGLDLSPAMLRRSRAAGSMVRLSQTVGDMNALPYPSGVFTAVTAGYGFRNAPDPLVAVSEVHRVLAPGGRVVTLDFYLPENRIWRTTFVGYLHGAGRLAGRLAHGVPEAYGYIAKSLQRWMSAADFSQLLNESGFDVQVERHVLFGGIAIHLAVKR